MLKPLESLDNLRDTLNVNSRAGSANSGLYPAFHEAKLTKFSLNALMTCAFPLQRFQLFRTGVTRQACERTYSYDLTEVNTEMRN